MATGGQPKQLMKSTYVRAVLLGSARTDEVKLIVGTRPKKATPMKLMMTPTVSPSLGRSNHSS